LVYQKMCSVDWARAWQPTWPKVAMTERPVNRERVAGDPALAGRSDVGDLPPRFESFLDELRRRMRERQLSYRTEQTYSNWVRRLLAVMEDGPWKLMAELLYGSGLRVMDATMISGS
jgi:hypothetical protein